MLQSNLLVFFGWDLVSFDRRGIRCRCTCIRPVGYFSNAVIAVRSSIIDFSSLSLSPIPVELVHHFSVVSATANVLGKWCEWTATYLTLHTRSVCVATNGFFMRFFFCFCLFVSFAFSVDSFRIFRSSAVVCCVWVDGCKTEKFFLIRRR